MNRKVAKIIPKIDEAQIRRQSLIYPLSANQILSTQVTGFAKIVNAPTLKKFGEANQINAQLAIDLEIQLRGCSN